jgi:hypothetical protein
VLRRSAKLRRFNKVSVAAAVVFDQENENIQMGLTSLIMTVYSGGRKC